MMHRLQRLYDVLVDSAPQATQANTEITLELTKVIGRTLLIDVMPRVVAWYLMSMAGQIQRSSMPVPVAAPVGGSSENVTAASTRAAKPTEGPQQPQEPVEEQQQKHSATWCPKTGKNILGSAGGTCPACGEPI